MWIFAGVVLLGVLTVAYALRPAKNGPDPSEGPRPPWSLDSLVAGGVVMLDASWIASHPKGYRLVDVRSATEHVGGYAEGSVHVPLGKLGIEAVSWDKDAPVALICASGIRSLQGAQSLRRLGFRHVGNVRGGMKAYRSVGKVKRG